MAPRIGLRRLKRGLAAVLIGAAGLAVVAVGGLLVVSNTDWGREKVRSRVLSILNEQFDGEFRIGKVDGNLLTGMKLVDIAIDDPTGAPFLRADTLQTDFALLGLVRKRILLDDMRLVDPVLVLDRRPGERWNYEKIFLSDTTAQDTIDTGPGFGSWIRIEDLEIVDGRMTVRLPWEPDTTLTGAARDSAVQLALSEDSRARVVPVPDGYQTIYEFLDLSATLPLLHIADPGFAAQRYEIASLTTVAFPFRPPPLRIEQFSGALQISGDSLWFDDAAIRLPGTEARAAFALDFDTGEIRTRVAADTISLADLQFAYPALPDSGGGRLTLAARFTEDTTLIAIPDLRVAIGDSRVVGELGLVLTEEITAFANTDLRFASLDTRLIEQVAPGIELPRQGVIDGRAQLDGPLERLAIDVDLAFVNPTTGRSRVLATGIAGLAPDGAFRAENLRVELRPLQVALAETATPDVPIGGTLTGTATIDGSTADAFRTTFDLAHVGRGERSRVAGRATVRLEPELAVDVDARLAPLSLATVGRFVPDAGLRGTVAGPVRLRGTLDDLAIDARLTTPDGGVLAAVGRADLEEPGREYALRIAADDFNPATVRTAGPVGGLNFVATVTGQGIEPATVAATLALEMAPSQLGGYSIDSATVRVAAADGLAEVAALSVWAPSSRLAAVGSLGLIAEREGQLAYTLRVDSLSQFASYLPVADDTGAVALRPAVVRQVVAAARADSVARAQAVEVARMALGGGPVELSAPVEEPTGIPRDSLSGSLYAAGNVIGSIQELDLVGRIAALNLVAAGNTVEVMRGEYRWRYGLTPESVLLARVSTSNVVASGFAFEEIDAVATYAGTSGTLEVEVGQDDLRDYQLFAGYRLDVDDRALLLDRMALRFDTTTWRSVRPSEVRLTGESIVIDSLELRDGRTGRIFADGTIPLEGAGAFDVSIRELPIRQLAALAQTDLGATGLLSLDARLEGTAASPQLRGALAVAEAGLGGPPFIDLRGTFAYADQRLTANVQGIHPYTALRRGELVLVAEATVPVNLALSTEAPRLPTGPGDTLAVAVVVDSLPLHFVAAFVPEILENVAGNASGVINVAGTTADPRATGTFQVTDAEARIVPLGIRLREVAVSLRLVEDSIVVDSLVGYNNGRIFVRGGIGIDSITAPSFDLYMVADGAQVLDNEIGNVTVDAGIALRGPFDAVYATGAVRIREGVLYIPENARGDVIDADDPALFAVAENVPTLAEQEIIAEPSPLLANLRANINLLINRGTWVRSREANVEIFTPDDAPPFTISIDQARQQLVLDGVVSTDRGEYTFLGKRFELREGSAVFVGIPEINPTLQLVGEYAVQVQGGEPITIRILIGGTLTAPRVQLQGGEGAQQLSQSDLISYLALGRGSASLIQGGGSSVTGGGAGGLVGRQAELVARRIPAFALNTLFNEVVLAQLEGSAGRRLGADVLNITPADLPIEATGGSGDFNTFLVGTEVELGRYLTPQVYLSVNARPSLFFTPEGVPRTQPGIRLQYRPRPGFELEGVLEPRFLLREPTLEQVNVERFEPRGAFGLFLRREWNW